MILNIYTIIMIFISIVSLVLGIALLVMTVRAIAGSDMLKTSEKTSHEKIGYLIFLLACVVLSIRMLAWPRFYMMLQSLVMEVPGAMCMFGVTQIMPSAVKVLQLIKPISFFVMGGWLLCYFVNKNLATAPLTRRIFVFLIPISGILLIDSAADIYYVLYMKPLMSVSCCTIVFDLPYRASAMIPEAIFGADFAKPLLLLFYLINIVLLALLFVSLFKKRTSSSLFSTKAVGYGRLIAAVINVPVVYVAFREIIAPRLMQLPLHHCIYCFIGNGTVPDAPIMLALFVIGSFAVGWMFIIRIICGKTDAEPVSGKLLSKVNHVSLFCMLSFVIMVTIHLSLL